jgi:hypothetical protein
LEAAYGYSQSGGVWYRIYANNAGAKLSIAGPRCRRARLEREQQLFAGLIFAGAKKSHTFSGDIHRHGFFKPRDIRGSHMDGESERPPWAGATFKAWGITVAIVSWMSCYLEPERYARLSGIQCAHYSCGNFRLAVLQ